MSLTNVHTARLPDLGLLILFFFLSFRWLMAWHANILDLYVERCEQESEYKQTCQYSLETRAVIVNSLVICTQFANLNQIKTNQLAYINAQCCHHPVRFCFLLIARSSGSNWHSTCQGKPLIGSDWQIWGFYDQFQYTLAHQVKLYWNWSSKVQVLSHLGPNQNFLTQHQGF